MKDEAILVLTTAPDRETAARLAQGLVDARLAACVNVIDGLRSFYIWKDALCDEPEVQLVIKSRAALTDQLEDWILRKHPYEVPEFLVLPVAHGSAGYLGWLSEQTTPPETPS